MMETLSKEDIDDGYPDTGYKTTISIIKTETMKILTLMLEIRELRNMSDNWRQPGIKLYLSLLYMILMKAIIP